MSLDTRIKLHDGFKDDAALIEAKGWYREAEVLIGTTRYQLTFYDPIRLNQDVLAELERGSFFLEPNVVVVPAVTRANIEAAVTQITASGAYRNLRPSIRPRVE